MRAYSLFVTALLGSVAASTTYATPAVAQEQSQNAIDRVGENLFRWTAGSYHSMFLVHDKGIVVADPLNSDAAEWLRAQLSQRYPDKPITHVLYSHSHPDHAYGGAALDDGQTIFIAHDLAAQTWELNQAEVRAPDIVFADDLTVKLPGGQSIDLVYWGANNGKGSVSMLFPEQQVLHVVDWIVLGRLPYQKLDGYDINGMINSTRAILAKVPFTTFVGGHADIGTREDVEFYLSYIEALHRGTLEGIIAGQSLEEIQQTLDLSPWSSLKQFDEWRDANIEGVYLQLVDDYYVTMRPEVSK